jgi:hypothetical protein
MSDSQGKGPARKEGGVEKNTSRPAENDKSIKNIQDATRKNAGRTFGGKK